MIATFMLLSIHKEINIRRRRDQSRGYCSVKLHCVCLSGHTDHGRDDLEKSACDRLPPRLKGRGKATGRISEGHPYCDPGGPTKVLIEVCQSTTNIQFY